MHNTWSIDWTIIVLMIRASLTTIIDDNCRCLSMGITISHHDSHLSSWPPRWISWGSQQNLFCHNMQVITLMLLIDQPMWRITWIMMLHVNHVITQLLTNYMSSQIEWIMFMHVLPLLLIKINHQLKSKLTSIDPLFTGQQQWLGVHFVGKRMFFVGK